MTERIYIICRGVGLENEVGHPVMALHSLEAAQSWLEKEARENQDSLVPYIYGREANERDMWSFQYAKSERWEFIVRVVFADNDPATRQADALERIAAALEARQSAALEPVLMTAEEAERDDPDGYDYGDCAIDEIDECRAHGWQVASTPSDYGFVVLRRPRQQDTPRPAPKAKPGDRVIFLDKTGGIVKERQFTAAGWDYLIRVDNSGETLTFYDGEFELDPIPF